MSQSKPLRTRLIHISQSYWTIYHSFEIILEWELSIALELKFNVLCNPLLQNTFNRIWIILNNKAYCRGQLGLQQTNAE